MARVTVWGKPGCAGNARQVALLRASGHDVALRDLRAEPWTPERLRPFFGDQPVRTWFNASNPRVKRGEMKPEMLSEADALAMMIGEPLLIRRPLLECNGVRMAGFDPDFIAGWIGLATGLPPVGEGCPRPDMPPCQVPENATTGAPQ
ncbi:MAG: ArsC/Spx/MgsR family protein [Acetobacteraceae bacterium]|nr:ArsC/Spx/MgsR family protein [Acetobacteraceae bacterium]